jgi:hypothetical protein
MKKEENRSDKTPFVAIAGSTGGIYLVIVIIFLIFSGPNAGLLVPLAWAFVVLAVMMGYFQMKVMVKGNKK